MSNDEPGEARRHFIEDVARLLVPWGVPQTAARLYGYLLLSAAPASLDRISRDLQISKSNASVAARLLEQYMLARRHGEPGSKRALYSVSDRFEDMLAQQTRLTRDLETLLRDGTRLVDTEAIRIRLMEMAAFYATTREALEAIVGRWRLRRTP